jgi:hypothetical protein
MRRHCPTTGLRTPATDTPVDMRPYRNASSSLDTETRKQEAGQQHSSCVNPRHMTPASFFACVSPSQALRSRQTSTAGIYKACKPLDGELPRAAPLQSLAMPAEWPPQKLLLGPPFASEDATKFTKRGASLAHSSLDPSLCYHGDLHLCSLSTEFHGVHPEERRKDPKKPLLEPGFSVRSGQSRPSDDLRPLPSQQQIGVRSPPAVAVHGSLSF